MRRHKRAPAILFLALFGALAAVADGPSFDLGDGAGRAETASDRIVVVKSVDDLALNGVSGQGAQNVAKVVGRVFKDNPEATRLRVCIGQATEGSSRWTYWYPREVTPLDDGNNPHGIQWLMINNDAASGQMLAYRLIPWEHGVKQGVEKEFKADKLVAEVPWKNGRMHGKRRVYFPDGKVKSETSYVDGLAEGPSRIWDENGKLLSESAMKAGKRHGAMTEYWPGTDVPQRVIQYKNDRIHGAVREFYSSGKLKRERDFLNEAAHGEDRYFDENGKLANLSYWFDGVPVSKEEFKNRSKAQKEMK